MTQLGMLLVHATWIKQMVTPFLMDMAMSLQQSLTMCPTIIQDQPGAEFVDFRLEKNTCTLNIIGLKNIDRIN